MDFLKDILGTELFEQVANAVNAYNGNEANKDKQIKIANLSSGKYVDKGKYTALEELLNKKDTDLTDAQKLIEGLKESAGKGEDMAAKIAEFETTIKNQQEELKKAKTESALKIELLSAGAKAHDYDKDGCINYGTRVTVSQFDGDWAKIPSGWVAKRYLKKV